MKSRMFALVTIVFVGGCASRVLRPLSVLNDGLPYQADAQEKDVLIYRNPHLKATSYSSFLIDPVKLVSNESTGHGVRPEEEAAIVEGFRSELTNVLKKDYSVVDKPGPGVLRIRTAIQDIEPSHVELDEQKFLVLRLDTLLARVAMELECVDSVTGERVVALIHTLYDRKYMDKEKTTRLLNIRDAFSTWAKSLKRRFDEAKSKPNREFDGVIDPENHKRLEFEEGR